MAIAGLFPGQGSQVVGMGKLFYESSELARELYHQADKTLGNSLSKLCFDGPLERLTLTEFAQPAILVTSYVAFLLLKPELKAAAGHSLGEYSALVCAGCLDFSEAVLLVHKRGRYMQEAVKPGAGKMVAVIGPTEAEILEIISMLENGVAEIANLNSPGQIVVSGDVRGVDAFSELIKEKGAKVIQLNVSAPFHCSLMEPAARSLKADLQVSTFSDPQFPVYANVTGNPVRSGAEARSLLAKQVCAPVRWVDCMRNLIAEQKISKTIEFGPGGVLSKLLTRIDQGIETIQVYDPATLSSAKALQIRSQA